MIVSDRSQCRNIPPFLASSHKPTASIFLSATTAQVTCREKNAFLWAWLRGRAASVCCVWVQKAGENHPERVSVRRHDSKERPPPGRTLACRPAHVLKADFLWSEVRRLFSEMILFENVAALLFVSEAPPIRLSALSISISVCISVFFPPSGRAGMSQGEGP